jgi:uncharacterized alpha-E superfamily protein
VQNLAEEHGEAGEPLRKIVGRLRAKVEFADMESIAQMGLHAYLTDLKKDLFQLSNALGRSYFAYN